MKSSFDLCRLFHAHSVYSSFIEFDFFKNENLDFGLRLGNNLSLILTKLTKILNATLSLYTAPPSQLKGVIKTNLFTSD